MGKKKNKEKIIKIDLVSKEDLYEKYNKNNVSRELIDYIIENSINLMKKDKIKIVIDNQLEEKAIPLIIEGLKREYNKCILNYNKSNFKQIVYLIVGIIALFISTLIEKTVLKEIVLIGGWVLIWTMVELEISYDIQNKHRRKILKKLLHSEIIENNKKSR